MMVELSEMTETEDQKAAPSDNVSATPSFSRSGAVIIKDRYLIDFDAPIPDLDVPTAGAFKATDRQDASKKIFALICTPGLPTRIKVMASIADDNPRGMLPLVEYDIVYWPPLGQSTMAIIYEQPLGGKLSGAIDENDEQISVHDISQLIIDPVVSGLAAFDFRNLTHRAIRPQNMYYLDAEKTQVVLGDCVTSPPGFDQLLVFETIERGMASPSGRGEGNISEDIYALGVTLVFFLHHGNPLEGMNEDEIFRRKLEEGSYTALCGKLHIPINLIEVLRGMLSDDEQERWGLEQISNWITGQRRTPIQKKVSDKSKDPFIFMDTPHHTLRALAHSLTENKSEAVKAIKGPKLYDWLRKSFHSKKLSELTIGLANSFQVSKGTVQGSDDFIVAKLAMALDPMGPVRYKGMSFMPETFGTMMAVEHLRQGDLALPTMILSHDIMTAWFAEQDEYNPDAIAIEQFFSQLKKSARNNEIGNGMERMLYELNPSLPCQSPLVVEDYVVYIDDLLLALDNTANRVDAKTNPMDRHIAAFIANRFNEDIGPHLAALASSDENKSLIGMLSLLAFLQWHLKIESLFGLSSWLGGLLGPAINLYHSQTTRREIEKELPKLVRKGDLPELFDLIDNINKRRKDTDDFLQAKREYATAEEEILEVVDSGEGRIAKHVQTAQKTAATSSILISMIVVTLLVLFKNW